MRLDLLEHCSIDRCVAFSQVVTQIFSPDSFALLFLEAPIQLICLDGFVEALDGEVAGRVEGFLPFEEQFLSRELLVLERDLGRLVRKAGQFESFLDEGCVARALHTVFVDLDKSSKVVFRCQ